MNNTSVDYSQYIATPGVLIELLIKKDAELAEAERNVNIYQKMLIEADRARFARKSERRVIGDDNQISLFSLIPEAAIVKAPEVVTPAINVPAHTRAARVKRDLSKLPHNRIEVAPESTKCGCCGEEMARIGEDVTKVMEYQPAVLYVNECVRPRFACSGCKSGVVQADSVNKPLAKSIAGASLLSHIITSKYIDHLPLHRQEQIFARKGLSIPRKNMCGWINGVVDIYLSRLWLALKAEVMKEAYLQGDETTLKVQDGEVEGRCHTGYLWGAYSPLKKLMVFEYAESRAGAVACEIFKDLEGTLQTDLYAGYNRVLVPDKVIRLACLAHIRRKFIEIEKIFPKETSAVLGLIAELYRLEHRWKSMTPTERRAERDKSSRPVLLKLEEYLRALSSRTLPKSPLMGAINYTLTQWDAVMRILDNGIYELDNNPIEREMRPIAIGRKNYLFAGSHNGARNAAIIYSLFATAKLHKVNPVIWLTAVLNVMSSHPVNKVELLLPHRFSAVSSNA